MKLLTAALSLLLSTTFGAAPQVANAFAPPRPSRSSRYIAAISSSSSSSTQRPLAPSQFFEDPRDVIPKTLDLYEQLGLESRVVLNDHEMKIFYEHAGEEFDFASFSSAYKSIIEGGVLTNFDNKFDFINVMRWLKVFQEFPELQKMMKEDGMNKAILRSAEIINEIENKRLKKALNDLRSYRDLLNVEVPDVFGGSEFFADAKNKEYDHSYAIDPEFESAISPLQMRCLALASHKNMEGTLRKFVIANKNLLKKFRLTGTIGTMTMLKEVFGDDPLVVYGPTCKSGPRGGVAELVASIQERDLGGIIFFQDPMESHHLMGGVDTQYLNHQVLMHNIMTADNPTSALMLTRTLRAALMEGKLEYIPSFLFSLECPTVEMYYSKQRKDLKP